MSNNKMEIVDVAEQEVNFDLLKAKENLVNLVCASMLAAPNFNDDSDPRAHWILDLVAQVATKDPEFILKLILYIRQDLNVRSTANFLMAVAANNDNCTPFIKKYYNLCVRLPSDWLDVAALYQLLPNKKLSGRALPTALRKAMVHKFSQFDPYQLDKYNKENSMKRKRKKAKERAAKLIAEGKEAPPPPPTKLTIKQMIRQLHINHPVGPVMCILGKKYPISNEEFYRSRLTGKWEPDRAGTRMKLPVAQTWETLVSEKGNKASTWEELIDNNKLPFMAMLRNLRNLILAGISPRHHARIIGKLNDERTVANSRQFPFSFFSAYEAINIDIDALAKDIEQEKERRKSNNPKKREKKKVTAGDAAQNRRPKKVIIPAHMPTKKLIEKYRAALDNAVKFATVHNIKPIRGSTVVFCSVSSSMRDNCLTARRMGSVRTLHEIGILLGLMCKYMCEECDFQIFSSPKTEHAQSHCSVQLKEGTILDNMKIVLQEIENLGTGCEFPYDYMMQLISSRKKIDNIIILSDDQIAPGFNEMVCSGQQGGISGILKKYRQEINPELLFVSVNLNSRKFALKGAGNEDANPNDVIISGFSDAILKYIAERGDGGQLEYIEHIDEAKGIEKLWEKFEIKKKAQAARQRPRRFLSYLDPVQNCTHEGCGVKLKKDALAAHEASCDYRLVECESEGCTEQVAFNQMEAHLSKCVYKILSNAKSGKWRTARVFISSTFLDMHGERDILSRFVFPELRERCKKRKVNFFEVDLRWGITSEENASSIEVCLSEVDRCRPFFIGLLGERYGWTPDNYQVSNDPRFAWLEDYAQGRSITELEMHYGVLNAPTSAKGLFYIRNNEFISEVDEKYKSAFVAQDATKVQLLKDLKQRILSTSDISCFNEYPAKWGGVVDGKPTTSGLEAFRERVTEDLWAAICDVFPEINDGEERDELATERDFHENFMELRSRRFIGRKAEISALFKFADSSSSNGAGMCGPLVVHGEAGHGKSALLASFVRQYAKKRPNALIISHFVGAAPGSNNVRHTLHRLCSELKRESNNAEEVPETLKELKLAFPRFMQHASYGRPVVIVIDGLNQFSSGSTSSSSFGSSSAASSGDSCDWLPSAPPLPVIVSTYTKTPSHTALMHRNPKLPFLDLPILEEAERKELVRQVLWEYRRKLEESPMNNQMRSLLRKTQANTPLWLVVACEELRLFGVYEELSSKISKLPPTIPRLFNDVLARLEGDHGKVLVSDSLSLIATSQGGLLESELLQLLAREATQEQSLPRGLWAALHRGLEQYLRPAGEGAVTSTLDFFHNAMKEAVVTRYLSKKGKSAIAHAKLAAYYLKLADPKGDRTFDSTIERAFELLPYHLLNAEMWQELEEVVCNLQFIFKKVSFGMTFDAVADLNQAVQATSAASTSFFAKSVVSPEAAKKFAAFSAFLSTNCHILAERPDLTFQQAANQPDDSDVTKQAFEIYQTFGTSWPASKEFKPSSTWFKWLNKPQQLDACKITLSGYSAPMLACAFSPDGKKMVCSSRDRSLRVWDAQNGTEIATLAGHSNAVVDCAFSPDNSRIVSASWDGTLKIWDATLGTCINTLNGHRRRVSTCCFSNDGTKILSGSWDCSLKLWDADTGKVIKQFSGHIKPVNACAFSPDDEKIVSASWDCTIKIWDCYSGTLDCSLVGHSNSVRAVAFSPNCRQIVSTSADCTVKVWDIKNQIVVHTFTGHSKPVNMCAYSSNGKHIVSASEDQTVKVWDALGGTNIGVLTNNRSAHANCVAIAPNKKHVATANSDCTLSLYNTLTEQEIYSVQHHTRSLTTCAFSPDGSKIATGAEDGVVRILEAMTGKELFNFGGKEHANGEHLSGITSLAFSPDGKELVVCSETFSAVVYNLDTREQKITLEGHTDSVLCCAYSPTGKRIATAGKDYNVFLWDSVTGKLKKVLKGHMDWVTGIKFSSAGSKLVTASWDFTVKVWDVRKGKLVHTLTGHTGAACSCDWSQDDSRIVSCSSDATLKLWDAKEGLVITSLEGHGQRVNFCTWSEDGKLIASCSDDKTVRLWDAVAGTEVTTLEGHVGSVMGCAFNPQKNEVVSASADCTVKVWDALKPKEVSGHSHCITGCSSRSNLPVVATCSRDQSIHIWDAKTHQKKDVLSNGHHGSINSVDLNNTGSKLVSGSDDSTVKIWSLDSGAVINTFTAHKAQVTSVAYSPVADVVISGSWDNTIRLWEGDGKRASKVFAGHTDWVNCCNFSNDGRFIISASHDETVKLWNANDSSRAAATLIGHTNWVLHCSFSPTKSNQIVSGSYDSIVNVWDTNNTSSALFSFNNSGKSNSNENSAGGIAGRISSCVFSTSGNLIITASHDRKIKVWDLRTNLLDATTEFTCTGAVTSLYSSSDSNITAGDSLGNVYFLHLVS